jgi:DNA-binding GntR family transcriptional regulator
MLAAAMRLAFLANVNGEPCVDAYDEHRAIVRAIEARDPELADRCVREHIVRAKGRTLSRL